MTKKPGRNKYSPKLPCQRAAYFAMPALAGEIFIRASGCISQAYPVCVFNISGYSIWSGTFPLLIPATVFLLFLLLIGVWLKRGKIIFFLRSISYIGTPVLKDISAVCLILFQHPRQKQDCPSHREFSFLFSLPLPHTHA